MKDVLAYIESRALPMKRGTRQRWQTPLAPAACRLLASQTPRLCRRKSAKVSYPLKTVPWRARQWSAYQRHIEDDGAVAPTVAWRGVKEVTWWARACAVRSVQCAVRSAQRTRPQKDHSKGESGEAQIVIAVRSTARPGKTTAHHVQPGKPHVRLR